MDKTIYQDNERTISVVDGILVIMSNGKQAPIRPSLYDLPNPVAPAGKYLEALKNAGKNPADYDAYFIGGLPILMHKSVTPALLAARDEYRAEVNAIRNDPANVERRRIAAMYAKARRHEDYPGEYYAMLADADAALMAWREKYPKAAARERAEDLRAKADRQESLAKGALVYDADGLYSTEDQERRAAEFRAKAAELRAEAAKIEEQARQHGYAG
jgi:hypothetical protein